MNKWMIWGGFLPTPIFGSTPISKNLLVRFIHYSLFIFFRRGSRWILETIWKQLVIIWTRSFQIHGENDGTLGMVPLIINSIYTLYSGCLLGFMRYIPF